MSKITVSLDGRVLQELTLQKERITIGRRPHNDIVLDMRAVSAEHAAIITILQNSFLEDLNSTNGTQVNGQPVRKQFLQDQDVIQLAKYEIRYSSDLPQRPGTTDQVAPSDFGNTLVLDERHQPLPAHGVAGLDHGFDGNMAKPVIRILNGPNAGDEVTIVKSLTTIGRPGVQVAVITRRPHGYLITHVEGDVYPLVDGVSIGASAHPIVSGDVIDLSGTEMRFLLR